VDRVQNLLTVALEGDSAGAPPGHDFAASSLTEPFGAVATGMGVYEIAPRNASWPYHFEIAEEEWLIVIDGELTLRTPEGETVLRTGDVACFPAGAAGAHAVRNHTDAPVRYAMPSTRARHGGATVYPDSGKFGIRAPGFGHRGQLGDRIDYWDGES
jgi:uncharacterized cupin superfamily protein